MLLSFQVEWLLVNLCHKSVFLFVVDNVFCTSCEKKLSVIESEYAKTLNKKNTQIYSSEIKVEISFLFWMSIIWRMSINKKSGTELTSGENEILRRILNRYLAESLESINIAEMKLAEDLKKISYKILRSPDYSDKNFTFLLASFLCIFPLILNM